MPRGINFSLLLFFLLTVIFSVGSVVAQPDKKNSSIIHDDIKPIRQSLVDIIKTLQDQFDIPGISLILVRNNETLWSEGFGYADVRQRTQATPDTVYRAGSLAKPFTAIAVMQLAEQGMIDIDQPLFTYLPEFAILSRFDTTAEPITPRNILCHHSGLPTDLNKGMWSHDNFKTVAAELNEEHTAYPPNLVFSYSNVGYTLLGHMVETNIGKLDFPDYMQQHIFSPIGMTNTGMRPQANTKQHFAKGYEGGEEQKLLPIRDLPAYGLYTSAADLGLFMRTMLAQGEGESKPILMPETIEEMLEPQNKNIPLDLNIINGLGWFIEEDSIKEGSMLIRHGGTTLLFSSELIILPDEGLGVAVLANAHDSRKVVSTLAEEILRLASENNHKSPKSKLKIERILRDVEESADAKIEGKYATDLGLIEIQAKDDRICGCVADATFDLIPYPNGWFGLNQDAINSLSPDQKIIGQLRYKTKKIDGKDVIIAQNNNKESILGERIPPEPISDVWKKRVGIYDVDNPDEFFPVVKTELLLRDDRLYMRYKMPVLSKRPIEVPLRPISDTEAIILGLGRTRGETLRAISKNGIERVRYSGFYGTKREN